MNKSYDITIVNGTGTSNISNGTYNVVSNVPAYDNTTILPASVEVKDGVNEYSFTIAATGTLTLHVTEGVDGTGDAVVGATFYRTDAQGTEYGEAVVSNASGNAVFSNVPFASDGAPLIYYKQTASDGVHEFSSDVVNTSLTESTKTVNIRNILPDLRTFNLTDANYSGLKVSSGTLSISNN